jgi:hypothetical protein
MNLKPMGDEERLQEEYFNGGPLIRKACRPVLQVTFRKNTRKEGRFGPTGVAIAVLQIQFLYQQIEYVHVPPP